MDSEIYIKPHKDDVGGTLCRKCGWVYVGNMYVYDCKKCSGRPDLMVVTTKRYYKNKGE